MHKVYIDHGASPKPADQKMAPQIAGAALAPVQVQVVVQTHWDREWYFPHQQFIGRLILVMERVVQQLESGQLAHFLFDGQTAALEDLLAHCEPTLGYKVRSLAHQGRIILGPWYVMADEFLCAGEALIRNLEIGIRDASAFGHCQMVGYLPDTFGHVSQMPQILRGFGIHSAVLWRGADAQHSEFDWRGPDGSVVGTVFLTQGYYQHPFNLAHWQTALNTYLNSIRERSLGSTLLLTQGGDHLISSPELADRIEQFNAEQSNYHVKQATLAEYVDTVLQESTGSRAQISGELRGNIQAFVLPDVLSTRRYLKQRNQQIEDRLLGAIEPLWAQLVTREAYPEAYFDKTWRLLLGQHAHDSICGCSADAVHQEMMVRFQQLDQRLDALQERACASAGMIALGIGDQLALAAGAADPFADDHRFTLFNPLPILRHDWQTISVFIKGAQGEGVKIIDADGDVPEQACLSVVADAIFRSPLDDFPERVAGHRYVFALRCALPGLTARRFTVVTSEPAVPRISIPRQIDFLENEFLHLSLDAAGQLLWLDKQSGVCRAGALSLLAELDAGDSYNFSPPEQQQQHWQSCFRLVDGSDHDGVQTLHLALEMQLPAALDPDRRTGSQTQVTNVGRLRLRLYPGQCMLDCELEWTNAARDQRTRLLFPIADDLACIGSDAAFSWEQRATQRAVYPTMMARTEMPVAVHPSYSCLLAGDLAITHRAMQEYEVVQHRQQAYLGLTLVRSVGWLSRRDLLTRGVGAGPDIATPEAQCLGTEIFHFQFGRLAVPESWHALQLAQLFRRPAVFLRGHTQHWHAGHQMDNPVLQVSSVRELAQDLEIRLWNPSAAQQDFSVFSLAADQTPDQTPNRWRLAQLDGRPCASERLSVAPHGIVTIRCSR